MIVAKYKFNPNTYENLLPEFNTGFSYTKSDTTNSDGTITRTIESDSLPTSMKFGESFTATDRSNSLLEVLSMNTSNLTTMASMFGRCTNLTSIVCNWNTSQVTSMGSMFISCPKLVSLDVSNFNTSQVTSMDIMFAGCSSLTQLNVSNWDTSKVTNMTTMFQYCSNLTSLDLSNWNTSNVTNMSYMFNGCGGLISLDVSNFNTSDVTNMRAMFGRCSKLTTLDLSKWDTSQVTNMTEAFQNCSSLTSLDISNWNTSKVTTIEYMFNGCSSLTTLDLNNWDTSKVTKMYEVFRNCKALTSLNISKWNTSQSTSMGGMFRDCWSLTSLDVSNWNISKVTNMSNMFNSCFRLTSLDLNNWNVSQVTNMYAMFTSCNSLTSLNVSNWDTSNVTTMNWMFGDCDSLRKVNLKYVNQSTVSKIHELLPDRSSTTKGYILSLVDLTSNKNWEVLKFTRNELYLPQPLRKVGDVKDRFYWDYDKGHYCIEQNISKSYVDVSIYNPYDISVNENNGYIKFNINKNILPNENHYNTDYDRVAPISNTLLGCSRFTYPNIKVNSFSIGSTIAFKLQLKYLESYDKEGIIQWFTDNPTYIYYISTPVIIDLPHLNQKFSFDTYLPNTNVKVTNLLLQPSKLLLEDDTVRYKSTIEPSTLYTIQFNCLTKSTTNLTLDLGGTRVTVDPIIGVNHVQITTPSELASDRLFLIGTGIVIKEVIVNKGNMNQYTKYFDGEQGVGELQDDGSYIIRISTDNYTNLWEGDL